MSHCWHVYSVFSNECERKEEAQCCYCGVWSSADYEPLPDPSHGRYGPKVFAFTQRLTRTRDDVMSDTCAART